MLVVTNLPYSEAPWLNPADPVVATRMVWREVELEGSTAGDFEETIAARTARHRTGGQFRSGQSTVPRCRQKPPEGAPAVASGCCGDPLPGSDIGVSAVWQHPERKALVIFDHRAQSDVSIPAEWYYRGARVCRMHEVSTLD